MLYRKKGRLIFLLRNGSKEIKPAAERRKYAIKGSITDYLNAKNQVENQNEHDENQDDPKPK